MGNLSTDSQFGPSSPRYGHFFGAAGHIWGPNEPILGPTETFSGPRGSKHGQKASQTVPKLMLSISMDNGTFWGALRRHQGPFLVFFGPFWAPLGAQLGPTLGMATQALGALWRPAHGLPVPEVIVCCPNTVPDSVVTFFSVSGSLLLWGPKKALRG